MTGVQTCALPISVQEMRIKLRWDAIQEANDEMEEAKHRKAGMNLNLTVRSGMRKMRLPAKGCRTVLEELITDA